MEEHFNDSLFGGWASDIGKSKWVLVVSTCIAIVLTIIYVWLMHWFAMVLAWVSVLLIQAGLIIIGWYFYA